jgi:hypothetical protein
MRASLCEIGPLSHRRSFADIAPLHQCFERVSCISDAAMTEPRDLFTRAAALRREMSIIELFEAVLAIADRRLFHT